jgi:hypothetical protein
MHEAEPHEQQRHHQYGTQLTEGEGKVVSREVVTRQKKGRMARLAVMPTACSRRPEWMKAHQDGRRSSRGCQLLI